MGEREWLASLKPGDEVAYCYNYGMRFVFDKVARLTSTQIVLCGTSTRFNRTTGRQVGASGYDSSDLWNPDEARKRIKNAEDAKSEAEKRRDKVRAIENLLHGRTLEQLDAIISALKAMGDTKPTDTGEGG